MLRKKYPNGGLMVIHLGNWYVRVVLNSFIWKTPSSPKKKYFRRTFANSMFIFRGTCWPRFLRKTWMCDILKLFQASDPSSHFILLQLHLNIYVLLLDVSPCSPSSVSSDTTSPQFRPPSLQMKVLFRQGFSKTFAKLSRKIPQ